MDESAVQQFFNQNRRQFDGTEINAAHIVKLYPSANRDRQQFMATVTRELTETRKQNHHRRTDLGTGYAIRV